MSTRGVGRLEESIVKDYKLSTVDLVSDPSIGNFVDGILESKDFMVDTHGTICEMNYDRLNRNLSTIPNHDKANYIGKSIKAFLEGISGKDKFKELDDLQKQVRMLMDRGDESSFKKAKAIQQQVTELMDQLYSFHSR